MAEGTGGTEVLPGDGLAIPLRLHNLLLALAGRLDDSALSETRELLARAHLDEAAELTAGTLIAGRIPVRAAERRELALVLEMSRSDATLVDDLTVDEAVPTATHRFSGDNDPERGIADALRRTIEVLPDLRSVHAVWRNTPAGGVPGPLPQLVVLVEIGPEGNPPAVAYRVDAALRRAGIRAAVEVSAAFTDRSSYHEAAMATARPAWVAGNTPEQRPVRQAAPPPRAAPRQSSRHASRATPSVSPAPVTETPENTAPPAAPAAPAPAAGQRQSEQASEPAATTPPTEEQENRAARTAEMSPAEVAQLRQALAEDPEKGREIAASVRPGEVVEIPELDLDDPQLSDRDRELLRELHAELAARERAEAARVNGVEQQTPDTRRPQ